MADAARRSADAVRRPLLRPIRRGVRAGGGRGAPALRRTCSRVGIALWTGGPARSRGGCGAQGRAAVADRAGESRRGELLGARRLLSRSGGPVRDPRQGAEDTTGGGE